MNRTNFWLHFRGSDRKQIMNAMIGDVEILRKFNLMDYSLLLCIQENPDYGSIVNQSVSQVSIAKDLIKKFYADELSSRHRFISRNGKFIYHIGIIDYLADYNNGKKVENFFKGIFYDGKMISAVPAKDYGLRFLRFMRDHVIIDQQKTIKQ